MQIFTRSLPYALVCLTGSLIANVAMAQNVTVDYIGSNVGDWKTEGINIDPTFGGSITYSGLTPRGTARNGDAAVPFNNSYSLSGRFDVGNGQRLSHGFFASNVVGGEIDQTGFGMAFINGGTNQDRVLLLVDGLETDIHPTNFNFANSRVTPDEAGHAFYNINFAPVLGSRSLWQATGDIFSNPTPLGTPISILSIDETFRMNVVQGESFGFQVEQDGFASSTIDPISSINFLQWRSTAVPEPSSALLLVMSACGLLLRRKK